MVMAVAAGMGRVIAMTDIAAGIGGIAAAIRGRAAGIAVIMAMAVRAVTGGRASSVGSSAAITGRCVAASVADTEP
jgi:hypothetical protein